MAVHVKQVRSLALTLQDMKRMFTSWSVTCAVGWLPWLPHTACAEPYPAGAQLLIQPVGPFSDKCLHCLQSADARSLRMQWSMWDRIQDVREQELGTLWRSFIIQALFGFTLNTIPVLVSVLTFGVYVLLGNKLTAAEAFTSLSLFTVCSPVAFAPAYSMSQSM